MEHETILKTITDIERRLNGIQDFDILLETLLTEARHLVNADAGSIYESDNEQLTIKYAQNDAQQARLAPGEKLPFVFVKFPINEKSISGYCAKTASFVNIPDVYAISKTMPYTFNTSVDTGTGYRTKSMLSVPLSASSGRMLGVLQIINALGNDGSPCDFDEERELVIRHFSYSASAALERAQLTRAMVMRMIEMARFRDPKETGPHVSRVSSYALEIYDRWAFNNGVEGEQAARFRDTLKIAATMHDVGKVGIPDQILKKHGKLTDEEYAVIKTHTCIGASLFSEIDSEIDTMSRDVALHHHERWDGRGYPGRVESDQLASGTSADGIGTYPAMTGEEIPLAARIVSLADVFDALCSARVYKSAWTIDDVMTELTAQSGKQFDPEVVKCFFQVLPRILEIRAAIPDSE
jgi:HD-GYP domain-containing protein (c-di-GMP phosphodiesterase class II)